MATSPMWPSPYSDEVGAPDIPSLRWLRFSQLNSQARTSPCQRLAADLTNDDP